MEEKIKNLFSFSLKSIIFYLVFNLIFFSIGVFFYLKYNEELPRTKINISINDFNKFKYATFKLLSENADINEILSDRGQYIEDHVLETLSDETLVKFLSKLLSHKSIINKTFILKQNPNEQLKKAFYNLEVIRNKSEIYVPEIDFIIYAFNDKEFKETLNEFVNVLNKELHQMYSYNLLNLELFLKVKLKKEFEISNFIPLEIINKEKDLFIINENYVSKKSSIYLVFSILFGLILSIIIHLVINISKFRD